MELAALTALSPLDGRYYNILAELRPIASEYGLIYFRLTVEIRWLMILANQSELTHAQPLEAESCEFLENILTSFDLQAAEQIKIIEKTTNHDVKAVEYYIRNQLQHHPKLSRLIPFIHFGCTSEDINNLAYGLMLLKIRAEVLLPIMQTLIQQLGLLAAEYKSLPMLARTHGQPASPTTLGKELANVAIRLSRQMQSLRDIPILAKFNGAIGNFNAHYIACPELDWPTLSRDFIHSLGLAYNPYTTQIEPHDNLAEILHNLCRYNTILLDLNRDLWGYTSLGYFLQKQVTTEVGSSTMPHKINPIDFENSEGNLGIANALAEHLASKLPVSRWQRDLSDSTVLRNLGSLVGYSLIAYQSTLKGIKKITINTEQIQLDLDQHWEILAEALQIVLRRHGVVDAYERLKVLTRGKKINRTILHEFIEQLPVPVEVKIQLQTLSPEQYLGYATFLTEEALAEIK